MTQASFTYSTYSTGLSSGPQQSCAMLYGLVEKVFAAPRRFLVLPERPLVGEVDAEARLASIASDTMTKGMYLAALMARLEPRTVEEIWPTLRAAPRHRKYQPFLDYPFADALRWLHAVARREHSSVSLLEGLRRLGRETVKVFLGSHAGHVIRSMNLGPRDALLRMPAMWKVTDPSHTVIISESSSNEVCFEVHGFPGWIDCGLIGTLEQVVLSRAARPEIEVVLYGPTRGDFRVRFVA